MNPGYHWRWGLKHPVQVVREAFAWGRMEQGHGRLVAALLVPVNAIAAGCGR